MTQRDNILTELTELGSSLASVTSSNVYQVPDRYFEGLAAYILNRIKAMDASDSREELAILSPVFNSIHPVTPYQVPVGYFTGLENRLMEGVLQSEMQQTAQEEIESLSPLLGGLKKQVPYSVPDNYFENLSKNGIEKKEESSKAKVISLGGTRKWMRYAAAAIVVGIIATASFIFLKKDNINSVDNSFAWVKKSLKQVSTDDLDQFIDMSDERLPVIASITPGPEAKELMNNLSDEEIQKFLDDVKDAEPDTDSGDDILLN